MSASFGGGGFFSFLVVFSLPLCFKIIYIYTFEYAKKGDSPECRFDTATVWLSTVNTAIRICHFDWVRVADLFRLLRS